MFIDFSCGRPLTGSLPHAILFSNINVSYRIGVDEESRSFWRTREPVDGANRSANAIEVHFGAVWANPSGQAVGSSSNREFPVISFE